MAFIDKVNTVVVTKILPDVTDGVFRNDPLLAFFRKNSVTPWQGGVAYQENVLYNSYVPLAFASGDTFSLADNQLITGATVSLRKYGVGVTVQYDKIKIDMAGPLAAFDMLDAQMQVAGFSLSGLLTNDLYKDGQGTGRTLSLNGLDEALNDGSTTGYRGSSFANYLTVARSSVNGALNSPMTGPAADVSGSISYPILESAWQSCVRGPEKPDLMITSNLGFSYIKMAFQPQQRFETTEPDFGFTAQQLNGTKIVASNYTPGTRTASTVDTNLGYAAIATGETLWYLNTKKFRLYVSTDPLFSFGFTGFKVAQDSLIMSGQYLAAVNFTCQAPWSSRYLFNITG